ncbi:MAG: LuxR C-terminal-related transcriptional regulator [Treponema sp.]|jgi:LuxR family maltose regulon positive regulatory protein|nr:LuxR C-terminal-related transcriptional regulator [Treponema sp.]
MSANEAPAGRIYTEPDAAPAHRGIFLERPRVDAVLAEACKSHLVTVIAGEGTGKTHAVYSFLQRDNRRVVWIQFSERDNQPSHFWENYAGEIARLSPEAAKIMREIGFPETQRQADRHGAMVKSGIVSRDPLVLVADDIHLVTNPVVLNYIEHLFSAPISKSTGVLISRMQPGINTLNFLAKGLLSIVTVDDLRFTEEETEAYFRVNDLFLDREEIRRIWRETEGWAMAIGLILREIKVRQDEHRRWDRVMLSLRKMEENIFSAMSAELQKFLIKLSLIEHWPRALLEQLEGGSSSITAMEQFSSVIRFDIYIHGFRIHHLFLDFLKEKQRLLSRAEIEEVCGKAARWCIENNLLTDAAADYERALDYGGLVRLIESLPRMLPKAAAVFFLETVDRLCAEPDAAKDGDWDRLYLRFIIRSRLLMFLDCFEEAAKECHEAVTGFEAEAPGKRRSRFLAAAYNNLGTLGLLSCTYTRDYTFDLWFEKGRRYYLENPEPVSGQLSQANIGSYVITVGFPAEGGEIDAFLNCYAASVQYVSVSMNGYLYGADTLARAELAYYQGDLNKAELFARQAVYQCREKKQYELENRALFYLLRIAVHTGNTANLQDLQKQMEALLEKDAYLNRYTIHDILMGRFYTRLGLIEKIAPWLRTEHKDEMNILFRGFDSLVKARCLFAEKNYPDVLKTLEEEHVRGGLGRLLLGRLEMTALEAVTRFKLGDREGAFAALEQAYGAAAPNNLDTPFIELGENMYNLINAVLKSGSGEKPDGKTACALIKREWLRAIREKASAYAKNLSLAADRCSGRNAPSVTEDQGKPCISGHEKAILSLLSQGRTEKEIAGEMKISPQMVKSAVRSLYVKLGASNRADAVRIAAEKGLLD